MAFNGVSANKLIFNFLLSFHVKIVGGCLSRMLNAATHYFCQHRQNNHCQLPPFSPIRTPILDFSTFVLL